MDIQINVKGTKDDVRPSDSHIVDRCANVLRQHGYKVEISWTDAHPKVRTVIATFLVLILTTVASVTCFSQYHVRQHNPYRHRVPEPVKVITIYASSIILDAVGDGLNDSGHKQWGHFCNAASVGILLTSPFIIDYDRSKWAYYLTSYVGLRIATFDYTYNITRGLPLSYIGGTSNWDQVMEKLNPPDTYMGRSVFLVLGVSIPINHLNSKKQWY